ncbi:MAG TPA: hypothetical protein VH110_05280 [Candidatus Acidoferrum sp.]|jgi:hypothetical protein|nr:hypothetical protein [Candidatus Acidoferrum sp.]
MTDEQFEERHRALAESVELLAGSTRDLRAVVEADLARTRERAERDRKYLDVIADVLKRWASENGERSA